MSFRRDSPNATSHAHHQLKDRDSHEPGLEHKWAKRPRHTHTEIPDRQPRFAVQCLKSCTHPMGQKMHWIAPPPLLASLPAPAAHLLLCWHHIDSVVPGHHSPGKDGSVFH